MNFKIDAILPTEPKALWEVFFDVRRIGTLIPGCESVEEKEPYRNYTAVLKQKIGPFKLEVPTEITVDTANHSQHLRLHASGRDKYTGTTIDVVLSLALEAYQESQTRLNIDSTLQIGGRLATLGYPVVKKKSEEIFVEFEKRLRGELGINDAATAL